MRDIFSWISATYENNKLYFNNIRVQCTIYDASNQIKSARHIGLMCVVKQQEKDKTKHERTKGKDFGLLRLWAGEVQIRKLQVSWSRFIFKRLCLETVKLLRRRRGSFHR